MRYQRGDGRGGDRVALCVVGGCIWRGAVGKRGGIGVSLWTAHLCLGCKSRQHDSRGLMLQWFRTDVEGAMAPIETSTDPWVQAINPSCFLRDTILANARI